MSPLTIITPTGERPEAFALCKRQMRRQTFKGPVYWIIVDDGKKRSDVSFSKRGWKVKTIRAKPYWQPGQNTQARNLLAGLDEAERHAKRSRTRLRLTVWEDDDWYSPEWLAKIDQELEKAELVGEGLAHYYNVTSRRHNPLRNYKHSSLRCSAMRDGAIESFREVLGTFSMYYDFKMWKLHENKHVFHSDLTIGIKGMPGRPGLAVGHDPTKGMRDPAMSKLREWIGADADWYAEFYKEPVMVTENKTKSMRALKTFKYGERGTINEGDEFPLRSNAEEALFIANGRACPLDTPAPQIQPRTTPKAKKLTVETQSEKLDKQTVEKSAEKSGEKDPEPDDKKTPSRKGPVFRGKKTSPEKDD